MLPRSTQALALVLLALHPTPQPPNGAPQEPLPPAPPSSEPASETDALVLPRMDADALAARDARVSFTAESARRARALLEAAPLDEVARAIALVALGASRSSADLTRIESFGADGKPTERKAAFFALAELGPDGWPALAKVLEREPGAQKGLESALAVALEIAARRGAPGAAQRLAELAQGDGELARAASAALATPELADEEPTPLALSRQLYHELRWRAAQRYGLVDGRRWQTALLEALVSDEEFLDRVILGVCEALEPVPLAMHLAELLAADERQAVLRAAARILPEELARIHEAGEWRPQSSESWRAVLDEIDLARVERRALPLLNIAFRDAPELASLSGTLIVRADGDLPWRWVWEQLSAGTSELRVRLVEACGDRGDAERIGDLVDLLKDKPELGLFGPGLVALARLGHAPAKTEVEGLVRGPASPERAQVVLALARVQHDRRMRRLAEQALFQSDLEPELALELELGLAMQGELDSHARLRELLNGAFAPALPASGNTRELALRAVRALGVRADEADLALLRSLFPGEDDLELNVELALALIRQRDPASGAILRAALWNDSWNRSILAGGVLARTFGLESLVYEIEAPPRHASERDLRRVGFSLGEWGGVGMVERLARTHLENDPALQGALLGAFSARTLAPSK